MKFLYALLTLMVVALLLGTGGWLVQHSLGANDWIQAWDRFGSWMMNHQLSGFGFGIALFLLVLAWGLAAVATGRQAPSLLISSEGGEVKVSLRAISEFVSRVGTEFKDVIALRPTVTVPGGRLRIDIAARIRSGAQVPDLSRRLQDRVKEAVRSNLGIEEIGVVRIFVREIVGAVPAEGTALRPRAKASPLSTFRDRPRDDYAMLDAPALSQLDQPEKKK